MSVNLNNITAHFKLQLQLLNRHYYALGLHPWVGTILLMVLFVLGSFYLFSKPAVGPYLFIGSYFWFCLMLSGRRRNDFLKLLYPKKTFYIIRIIENLIMAFPFLLFLFYQKQWLLSLSILILSMVLSTYAAKKTDAPVIPTPFGRNPFEFVVGFRKTFPVMVLFYIIGIIGAAVHNFNLIAVALGSIFLVSAFYYSEPEQEYFVWIFDNTAVSFIKNKIYIGCKQSLTLVAPLGLLLCTVFYEKSWICLIIVLCGLMVLITMILAKYAAYPKTVNVAQGFLIYLVIQLPPLIVFILPLFYLKAVKNLKSVLQ